MDIIEQYQINIDSAKKEFGFHQNESLYEIFNRVYGAYQALKQNQSERIENGTDTRKKRGRPRKTDS